MSQSKKHHYLPQFYLKGFTDNNGEFYIYDKKKEEIRKSTPQNMFYEKFRNSVDINNQRLPLIEDIYSEADDTAAPFLKKIRDSNHTDDVLDLPTILNLNLFLSTLRWRLPTVDKEYDECIDKLKSFKSLGLSFNGITNSDEEISYLKDSNFRKVIRPIYPLLQSDNFIKGYGKINNRILYQDPGFYITSDFPFITKGSNSFASVHEDLIFPVSTSRALLITNDYNGDQLPAEFTFIVNMSIIDKARQYVCSPNREWLTKLVKLYPLYKLIYGERLASLPYSYFR